MEAELTIKNYRCFEDSEPLRFIIRPGFTAFIGPNNSGKSSILKFMYEFRPLWSLLSGPTPQLSSGLSNHIGFTPSGVHDWTEVYCNHNERDIEIEFGFPAWKPKRDDVQPVTRIAMALPRSGNRCTVSIFASEGKLETKGANVNFQENRMLIGSRNIADFSLNFEFFQSLASAMYVPSFRNAINAGGRQAFFDISVGISFIGDWQEWQAGAKREKNAIIQRVLRDIREVFRYTDLQIVATPNRDTLQVNINDRGYKLAELGGGITQFILVLGNAAIRSPSFILIDEPELNLHPSLQLDFLTALGSYSTHGIMFATHSLGLARSSADQIYSVYSTEGRSKVRPLEDTPNLAQFMGELSFSSYAELGFHQILLVEGVNDVKTVQQFLRFLRKDQEIVLVHLGGGQLINESRRHELNEIKRITGNISVLIDSEKEGPDAELGKDRQAFCQLCKELGFNAHVTEHRAIENYFTQEAIRKAMGSTLGALGPFEKPNKWPKNQSWRIAREMGREDIIETDLGKFLEAL